MLAQSAANSLCDSRLRAATCSAEAQAVGPAGLGAVGASLVPVREGGGDPVQSVKKRRNPLSDNRLYLQTRNMGVAKWPHHGAVPGRTGEGGRPYPARSVNFRRKCLSDKELHLQISHSDEWAKSRGHWTRGVIGRRAAMCAPGCGKQWQTGGPMCYDWSGSETRVRSC
jgi:hypothetical protein